MQKIILLLVTIALLAMLAVVPASAQTAIVCESTQTVTAGDWLSKIAEKVYGSAQAYFPIFSATNSQAIADKAYHFIDNADQIEVGWQLCIPAQVTAPAGLDTTVLANASYKSEFSSSGTAKLTNGKFSEPAAPGSASQNTVELTNSIAYGELDGVPSAAVVLVESGGGSGVFSTLHVVQNKDGVATDVASTMLGDRVNVTTLFIANNQIFVGMTTQGPDDAMCCPTQRVLNTYTLNGDKLEQTSTQVVGKVEPAAPSTAQTPSTGAAASQQLTGVVWKWTTTLYNDGKTITPADPNRYLIEFLKDDIVAIQADCNRVGGTYKTDGNQLTITLGPSTLAACPPDSQADEFTKQLTNVTSYLFQGDNLILEFKFDSGTMTLAPSAPTGLAGTSWTVTGYNNGKQAVVSVIIGTEIALNFGGDGQVSGNAGCNTYTGKYETGGDTLKVGPLATTRKLCTTPEGVMDQEAQYLAALQNAATYKIEGNTLTLRDASGAMQVTATMSAPTGLADTSWKVTGYNNGKQAVVSVLNGTEITLNFGADGRVSGNSGCNTYSGEYKTEGDALKIGPLISTLMACESPEGVMEQEAQYLAALQNAATYQIDGSMLTIRDAEGAMQITAAK